MRILVVNNEKDKDDFGWLPELKKNVLQIVDGEILVKHLSEVSSKTVEEYDIDYVILSGRINSSWTMNEEPLFKGEYDLIRNCRVPLMGICAGVQLIGTAHGVEMNYICPKDKEKIREKGYLEIKLLKEDQIFKGLTSPIVVYEHHCCELKAIPKDFIHLAASDLTPIQCIKHKSRNIYGFQFHPEKYNDEYQDGKVILTNFFALS